LADAPCRCDGLGDEDALPDRDRGGPHEQIGDDPALDRAPERSVDRGPVHEAHQADKRKADEAGPRLRTADRPTRTRVVGDRDEANFGHQALLLTVANARRWASNTNFTRRSCSLGSMTVKRNA